MTTLTTVLAAEITLRRVLVLIGLVVAACIFIARRVRTGRRNAMRRAVRAAYDDDPLAAADTYRHPSYDAWLDHQLDEESRTG
ncbi:MAG: hypothetical protein ACYTGG_06820 [Planctomycetota bacterium]|jgi:hypothetical protein